MPYVLSYTEDSSERKSQISNANSAQRYPKEDFKVMFMELPYMIVG